MGLTRKLLTTLAAAATAITAASPTVAMPVPLLMLEPQTSVEEVQYRDHRLERRLHRHGWYGGHRGYRAYRHGYRQHSDGWWYPLAAFGAGTIIAGAVASSRQPVAAPGIDPRHYDWCSARYRTYRAADNMYVLHVGALAECRSPYY